MFTSTIYKDKFFLLLIIFIKVRVGNSINIYVTKGMNRRLVGGVESFDINFMGGKEKFKLVNKLIDKNSLSCPVNNRVG